jgi:hypothetical protein
MSQNSKSGTFWRFWSGGRPVRQNEKNEPAYDMVLRRFLMFHKGAFSKQKET